MTSKDAAKAEKEALKEAARLEKEAAKAAAKAEKDAAKAEKNAEKDAAKAEKTAAKEAAKQQREEEKAIERQAKEEKRNEREAALQQRLDAQREAMEAQMIAGREAREAHMAERRLEQIQHDIESCVREETMSRSYAAEYEEEARVRIAHERLAKEGRLAAGIVDDNDDELTRQAKQMERLIKAIEFERSRPKAPIPAGRVHIRAPCTGRYLSNENLRKLTQSGGVYNSETFNLKSTGGDRRELCAIYNGKVASFGPGPIQLVDHRDAYSEIELVPSLASRHSGCGGLWNIKVVKSGHYVRFFSTRDVEMTTTRNSATDFEILHASQ